MWQELQCFWRIYASRALNHRSEQEFLQSRQDAGLLHLQEGISVDQVSAGRLPVTWATKL